MSHEILRFAAVKQATGLSRTTVWRLERAGLFPRRRQITPNTVGWLRQEISDWIASREPINSKILAAQKTRRA